MPSLDPTRRLAVRRGTLVAARSWPRDLAAAAAVARTADRAAVVTGAELLGLADTLITPGPDYARERRQFDRPIGSFQAVKHLLAGVGSCSSSPGPSSTARRGPSDSGAPDASRAASVAKAYASDAAVEAARVSLQVHGAIGYTWECDLQLFLKRAWALSEAWGSAGDHRARVLDSLLAGR